MTALRKNVRVGSTFAFRANVSGYKWRRRLAPLGGMRMVLYGEEAPR
jgi:hypothetical protein